MNKKKFMQHKFHAESIERNSELHWHPLSHNTRLDFPYKTTRTSMELNDHILNVAGIRAEEDKGFYVERLPTRLMPYKNSFLNSVTFEMSLN